MNLLDFLTLAKHHMPAFSHHIDGFITDISNYSALVGTTTSSDGYIAPAPTEKTFYIKSLNNQLFMEEFNKQIQQRFAEMCATGILFKSEITGAAVWDLYLSGFAPEDDPVFRDPASTVHNCNHCKNFIRRYGNIVALDADLNIMTLFDNITIDEYVSSARIIVDCLEQFPIKDVFVETLAELKDMAYEVVKTANDTYRLGHARNEKMYSKEEAEIYGVVKPNEVRTFRHFHLDLPKAFVDSSGKSDAAIIAGHRDAAMVFHRGLTEIPLDTLRLVKDLILQGSLLDGTTHLHKIEAFTIFSEIKETVAPAKLMNYCWRASHKLSAAKFKNELIGVLCSDLAEGMELNKACELWNRRVDPVNYMKASAPITKRQIEEAKKFVEENEYEEAFDRRFATIDDIKVSEILHSNVGNGTIKNVSMFDNVKSTSTRHKKSEFEGVEEVTIEKFMKDILPGCTSVEAFLLASHEDNLLSLTTANSPDLGKGIFKWNNNYSWTYNGNLAGKSFIKEAVASKGGRVDGVLRFSIIWNDGDGTDSSDLDAWCVQSNNIKIGFNSGYRKDSGNVFSNMSGQLDLDIQQPNGKLAVENIYFVDVNKMQDGDFKFYVNQYAARNSKGFKAEIEFNGEIYTYEHNEPIIRNGTNVPVATVNLKNKMFSIVHEMPCSSGLGVSKEIYSLDTNQFHKVNLVCLSPNHWGENNVGNKHYFFMLEGCKTPNTIRSFHAENLLPELAQHRKVLEVLGATNMIAPADKQLSGLGFNSTVSDELVVRLQGTHKRVVRIKFNNN
jgi:hypothetical protein